MGKSPSSTMGKSPAGVPLTFAKYQGYIDAGRVATGTLVTRAPRATAPTTRIYIPLDEVKKSIEGPNSWRRYGETWTGAGAKKANGLWRWLAHNAHEGALEGHVGLAAVEHVTRVCMTYLIGNTTHYTRGGGVVFWYINEDDDVEAAQVVCLERDGKTARWKDEKGTKRRLSTWWHSAALARMKRAGVPPLPWLVAYAGQQKKQTCMFGVWLLHIFKNRTVALVEAPKTAVVMSLFSRRYVWLAVGALTYLTAERVAVLGKRPVVVFADKGAEALWSARARRAGLNFTMDTTFKTGYGLGSELGFSVEDALGMEDGVDIADLVTREWVSV